MVVLSKNHATAQSLLFIRGQVQPWRPSCGSRRRRPMLQSHLGCCHCTGVAGGADLDHKRVVFAGDETCLSAQSTSADEMNIAFLERLFASLHASHWQPKGGAACAPGPERRRRHSLRLISTSVSGCPENGTREQGVISACSRPCWSRLCPNPLRCPNSCGHRRWSG
jgi:hypothetical protein